MKYAVIALVAAGAVAGCQREPAPAPAGSPVKVDAAAARLVFPKDSPQLSTLTVEPARESAGAVRRLTGRVVWDEDRTVRLYSPFAGRILSITAKAGDRVEARQALATVGSPDFGQTVAELRKAESDHVLAERNLARQKELLDHGVAAARDVQSAEADLRRTEAELERTRSRARLYGGEGNAQGFVLRAPQGGVIVERNVNPGQEVRPDQMTANSPPLFVVTDPQRLWVLLDAAEADLGLLKVGLKIPVQTPAYPGETFTAHIATIPDFIDPGSRVLKVRATIANTDRRLKAEMFVTAELAESTWPVLAIPAAAAFLVGQKHFAFVERAAGEFERVELALGTGHAGVATITAGLKPGDRVVTGGALYLQQLLQGADGAAKEGPASGGGTGAPSPAPR